MTFPCCELRKRRTARKEGTEDEQEAPLPPVDWTSTKKKKKNVKNGESENDDEKGTKNYSNSNSYNPELNASLLSGLLFWWLQPLFTRAALLHKRGKALQHDDLPPLPTIDYSKAVEDRFEAAYKDETIDYSKKETDVLKQQARLLHALWKVCDQRLITAGIIKFFNTGFQFTFPILLNAILRYFEDVQNGIIPPDAPGTERYKGYWLAALIFFFIGSKALTEVTYFHKVNRCSWQLRTSVSGAVYRKALKLASSAQHQTTLGEMVNLMQVDATKIEMFVPQIHVLWDGLFQIAGYMAILGTLLGWPCVMGLIVMMFAGPVMGIIMGKLFGINRAMVKHTDQRVKTINEALQGIRSVKLYTWEASFAKQIGNSRIEELKSLKHVAYLRGFSRAYMTALPTLAAVATFLCYTYATDRPITASILFSSIVAFDQLRFPLMFYPMAIAQYAQAKVSLNRLAIFLSYMEVSEEGYHRNDDGNGEIKIENTTIYWSDPKLPMTKAQMEDKSLDKSMHTSTHSNKSSSKLSTLPSVHEQQGAGEGDGGPTIPSEELIYPKPVVSDITLHVAPGDLYAVVGRVGSGKSSLCSAILNETILQEGSSVTLQGTVAYVAQSAWILNKTVRENILFGLPYDAQRYHTVLRVCQLTHDLELLQDGDMTEIGEKGINLSGGQKQRISVARAAYSEAKVIIMDDPLSALDPEVAQKLFDDCIVQFLHDRTRLLVTNQLQCLPQCDSVICLSKGRVLEQGTYSDLMKMEHGAIQQLLKDLEREASQQKSDAAEAAAKMNATKDLIIKDVEEQPLVARVVHDESTSKTKKNFETKPLNDGEQDKSAVENADDDKNDEIVDEDHEDAQKLMTKEERFTGAVSFRVYWKYVQSGGGFVIFALVFIAFALSTAVNLVSGVLIALWTSDTSYERFSEAFYIGGYAGVAILMGVFTFARSYVLATFGVKASNNLHSNLMDSIFRAPMTFFDTTPTGRILSRFSKDMYTVDQELSDYLDFFIFMSLSLMVTMATIIFATPWFGVVLIPMAFLYFRILNYFRDVSRETKRLESISRSPVYALFSETLGGLSTIRAYGASQAFVTDFESKLDSSTQAGYCNKTAERWLSCRLELIGAAIAGLAAVFSTQVIVSNGATAGDKSSFASLAGLSLSYAITVTGMLQFVVRTFAQVEAAMNSCERVLYYSEQIAKEAAMESKELEDDAKQDPTMNAATRAVVASGGKAVHPSPEWPQQGAISLKNLQMRYRSETPLVLKGLNVTIAGGERIGVVGRTGSGKSSLLLCLMRIVEPELGNQDDVAKYEAPLMIDGIDVLRVGLLELRSKIGIIPQSPVLFSGTIRSNIDPFDDYTDDEIWTALDKCGMHQAVLAMPDELNSPVAEYGENLSQGQRQLLCLGRALLKQCRILLLDEATSSVDFETDREIQRTIRQAFAGSTVLTIAHRINTIMDSDKILVMKDGVAAEFAPPQELLQDDTSLFSDIVRHSQAEE